VGRPRSGEQGARVRLDTTGARADEGDELAEPLDQPFVRIAGSVGKREPI
jgi:hypothetical protein